LIQWKLNSSIAVVIPDPYGKINNRTVIFLIDKQVNYFQLNTFLVQVVFFCKNRALVIVTIFKFDQIHFKAYQKNPHSHFLILLGDGSEKID
jgi:hypothetical protein